jgi:hypothetical protein
MMFIPIFMKLDEVILELLQIEFTCIKGCVIAQAVSSWLPTAAVRVRARVWQVGFVVDKVALGQVFSEYFGFPMPNFTPSNSPSLQSPGADTIGHSVADVPSGFSSTPHNAN